MMQRLATFDLTAERLGSVEALPQTRLAAAMRDGQIDCLHQGDFTYSLPALAGVRNRMARRIPLSGITHSLDGARMHRRFVELALAGLQPYDGIVCTSRTAQRFVEESRALVERELLDAFGIRLAIPVATTVIPLGVDDVLFSEIDKQQARVFFEIPQDRTVVLQVARLSTRSKCDLAPVLELLGRMNRSTGLGRSLFIFAGGGVPETVDLASKVIADLGLAGHVVLFPNFPPEKKRLLYAAADIALALVDNYQETFGLAVVEAMAGGLPVIAADFDGYRDSVRDGENGILIPTAASLDLPHIVDGTRGLLDPSLIGFFEAQAVAIDLPTLGRSLQALLSNVELRSRLGARSGELAESYRWPRLIAAYEDFWRHLLSIAASAESPIPSPAQALVSGGNLSPYYHFPSTVLGPDARIAASEHSARVLSAPDCLVRYSEMDDRWPVQLETRLLEALVRGPHTVGELQSIARQDGFTASEVLACVAWLLKHDALRLG
jgi:glycosyltransferase involved in cell wall biosynthesis